MTTGTKWAGDGGPAGALLEGARRLDVPVSADDVRERFEMHESPGSLRALVEVAADLGIEARAFRSDPAGLGGVATPAVVHLQVDDHGTYAFGLLLESRDGGLVLDRGDGAGPVALTRDGFLRLWTGVVVTLVRNESAVVHAPRAGLLWRARRAFLEGDAPWHHRLARGLGGVAVLALAARALLGLGALGAGGAALGLVALLALVAGGVAAWALYYKSRITAVPSATPRLASRICGRGKVADCAGVLTSRWARVLGVDLASIGLAAFAAAFATLALAGLLLPAPRLGALLWLGAFFVLAAPVSIFFAAVQVWPLGRLCTLCMTVHAVVTLCAASAVWLALRADAPWAALRDAWPWAAIHGLLFAGAFALLVPFLDLELEARTSRVRLAWLSATPWGALAELLGRPRAIRRPVTAGFAIGSPEAPFRVEALVHPMCSGCGPVVQQLIDLERERRGLVSIGIHLPPRDPFDKKDRETCAAIAAIGIAAGGHAGLQAFLTLKTNPWAILAEGRYRADGIAALVAPRDAPPIGEEHLARAREAVAEADRLAGEIERGTPTLLLEGRPWESPVEDLVRLLDDHAEVVAGLLRIRLDRPPARDAARGA